MFESHEVGDFEWLGELLGKQLARFEIAGGAVTVMIDGQCVAEYCAGDARPGVRWTSDTIGDVASVSKVLTATAALLLVDRGELDLDRAVRDYWPGFTGGGKEQIIVRHLLTHQAGLVGIRSPRLPPDVLLNWDEMIGWLEREPVWWLPGQAHGYHAFTSGYLIGELVRRVSGATRFRDFVMSEISRPLRINFHIGVPNGYAGSVADAVRDRYDPTGYPADDSPAMKMNNPPDPGMGFRNSSEWRRADIPAVNGHGSATGLARLASMYACGGELDGTRFLSEHTVHDAVRVHVQGVDWFGNESAWGLGFAIDTARQLAGGIGGGGSHLWISPEHRLGYGYVHNTSRPVKDTLRVSTNLIDACLSSVNCASG